MKINSEVQAVDEQRQVNCYWNLDTTTQELDYIDREVERTSWSKHASIYMHN